MIVFKDILPSIFSKLVVVIFDEMGEFHVVLFSFLAKMNPFLVNDVSENFNEYFSLFYDPFF
jgi:hypothetical protein